MTDYVIHDLGGLLLYRQWKMLQHQPFTTIEAVKALQLFAKNGEAIPAKLLPYLDQVCGFWDSGNQMMYQIEETRGKWSVAAGRVKMLMKCGLSRTEAILEISDLMDVEDTTLLKEYKSKKTKAARKEAEELYNKNTPPYSDGHHKT